MNNEVPRALIESPPTEAIMLFPTRDFDTNKIDGIHLRVPVTVPGSVVHELLTVLDLEPDDEWQEDGLLIVTAVPRSRTER